MTIVHICLACFYIDGMNYQENILPKKHKEMGNTVYIITSDYAFDSKGNITKKELGTYINENGISVTVLDKDYKYGFFSKWGDYKDLTVTLEKCNPDIIFVHGGQFISLLEVIKYKKNNPTIKVFIDQHADYYNAPVNTYKQKISHKCIYKYIMQKAVRFTERFWGVTPWRCQYLHEIYGIPKTKIDLLVMGGDDDKINFANQNTIRKELRSSFNLSDDDFVIVTGGKIDKTKNIHLLMQAVQNINRDNVKLIVFGQPNDTMEEEIQELAKNQKIRFAGWIAADKVYDYFLASDLAVFPGTHSVLWEQACACGIPCVFKSWEGMHHIDLGGNCEFLYADSIDELQELLTRIVDDTNLYHQMKQVAMEKGIKFFSYKKIAKKALDIKE